MLWWSLLFAPGLCQFGNLFDQIFQQQQQQAPRADTLGSNPVEKAFHEVACDQWLCPDSLVCVASPQDCPCPFPDSQLKCVVGESFVCISKPSNGDGPDCDFVKRAYAGKV